MKSAAFFVLSAVAVLAADPTPQPTGPQFQGEYAEVPDPVPVGYQRCVRAISYPKHRAEWGLVAKFPPPLDRLDAKTLNYVRKAKIARLVHCRDGDA